MIRPTVPEDTPELLSITQGTSLFLPADLQTLEEVLSDYHKENAAQGHRCFTDEVNGKVIGFVYYAPAMTDRTWYLWWIVVSKHTQARGVGGKLLKHAEDAARADNGRLMMIDTSSYHLRSDPAFYLKHGYEIAAVIKDFYADGHDLVMFRKRLSGNQP